MKFANPYLLNLLWLLFPVAAVLIYGIFQRKKILYSFAQSNMLNTIIPGFHPNRRWTKAILILLAATFAIVAMAGPQWGFRWQKVKQKGVDIMIALDCSKSMLAQDIAPNRLERAKREIIDLLRMMQSDRAGLVAFSGQAILQCPLTLDHQAFNVFLKVLEPGFLPSVGTNLGAAIRSSYNGFEKDSDTKKAIILITDGESTSGDVDKIVQQMVKEDIKIFCIGVGDLQGAPIPDEDGGFKKDRSGNIILSKVDENALKKIADMTNGAYVRSVAGDMDLDLIYTDKIQGSMEKKTLVSGKKKIWENRYQWFLLPCIVLLIIEFLLPSSKSVKTKNLKTSPVKIKSSKNQSAKVLLMLAMGTWFIFQPSQVLAQSVSKSVRLGIEAFELGQYEQAQKHFIDAQLEDPDDQRLYYNIGTAAYMAKEFDQAKTNFAQAAKSENIDLRHNALYNLANTQYQLGQLDDAIQNYENLLKEFPEDVQAKENLEFVKQKKQEQKQNPKNKDSKNKDNKDKQDKNNQDKDQNQKDQNNKDQSNKDQDSKDQDKKDQNQQQDQKENQDKEDAKSQNENGDQDPEKPEDKNEQDQDQGAQKEDQAKADKAGKNGKPSSDNQNMQKMLNRLEDKPGRAMVPVGKRQNNGKDW